MALRAASLLWNVFSSRASIVLNLFELYIGRVVITELLAWNLTTYYVIFFSFKKYDNAYVISWYNSYRMWVSKSEKYLAKDG